jgi:hypothetical protein
MERRNITLSLPSDVLRRVKIMAVNKDTSVSALLTDTLIELVRREDAYEEARAQHLDLLRTAPDLGTQGSFGVPREALHERRV